MNAQDLRASRLPAHGADPPGQILNDRGHHHRGGQVTRRAHPGKRLRHVCDFLFVRPDHLHATCAMDMEINEAGSNQSAFRINGFIIRIFRQVGAYAYNSTAFD